MRPAATPDEPGMFPSVQDQRTRARLTRTNHLFNFARSPSLYIDHGRSTKAKQRRFFVQTVKKKEKKKKMSLAGRDINSEIKFHVYLGMYSLRVSFIISPFSILPELHDSSGTSALNPVTSVQLTMVGVRCNFAWVSRPEMSVVEKNWRAHAPQRLVRRWISPSSFAALRIIFTVAQCNLLICNRLQT